MDNPWSTRPDPVASPRAYDLWADTKLPPWLDDVLGERVGAGIPVGQTGEVMGRDGKRHACRAGYDGEGVYGWSCICGDGGSDFGGKDEATLASGEHLLDVGAMVEATL